MEEHGRHCKTLEVRGRQRYCVSRCVSRLRRNIIRSRGELAVYGFTTRTAASGFALSQTQKRVQQQPSRNDWGKIGVRLRVFSAMRATGIATRHTRARLDNALPAEAAPRQIASLHAIWYLAEVNMSSSYRIGAAVLILIALLPTTLSRPNVICVESSGRITYGCNDVVPDEMSVHRAVPVQCGFSSIDCGMCHDYAVGQAVSHSFQDSAPPVPVIGLHPAVPFRLVSTLRKIPQPVAFLDSSGGISPLKC